MATRTDIGNATTRTIAGHEVTISNPEKILFPKPKYTKLDLVNYYLAVADGALRGAGGRPNMLVRFPNGIGAPSFYQKRAPESRRSEEHTSELQSQSNLVCRLLLEKKKHNIYTARSSSKQR